MASRLNWRQRIKPLKDNHFVKFFYNSTEDLWSIGNHVTCRGKWFELGDQENDLVFISELFECYFSGPWIHGISRCDHSSVVHSTSILLSHYKGLNVEKFLLFFLLKSVLTLYNHQVQSFPSILNTSFLFTFVFQAHDQAVTGLSLHATGNLILSTVLTLMLTLSLILYSYKSACTRSSIGTPARSPN